MQLSGLSGEFATGVLDSLPAGGTAMSIANRIARSAEHNLAPNYTIVSPSCDAPRNRAVPPRRPAIQPTALRCAIAGRTDRGMVRRTNQDTIDMVALRSPDGGTAYLGVVADGVGGAYAGEQASALAAAIMRERIELGVTAGRANDDTSCEQLLREAVRAANRHIYQASHTGANPQSMGTTLTIVLIVGDRAHIASVGDSRAYLLRASISAGRALVAQLTTDHSVVAQLVEAGRITPAQARIHPQRSLLYRTIGAGPTIDIDTVAIRVKPGDRILLCSDGLVEYVSDEELAQIALRQPDPAIACERLVELANQRGGADNSSVVIARVA
jgi:PPM family protein phosphatase